MLRAFGIGKSRREIDYDFSTAADKENSKSSNFFPDDEDSSEKEILEIKKVSFDPSKTLTSPEHINVKGARKRAPKSSQATAPMSGTKRERDSQGPLSPAHGFSVHNDIAEAKSMGETPSKSQKLALHAIAGSPGPLRVTPSGWSQAKGTPMSISQDSKGAPSSSSSSRRQQAMEAALRAGRTATHESVTDLDAADAAESKDTFSSGADVFSQHKEHKFARSAEQRPAPALPNPSAGDSRFETTRSQVDVVDQHPQLQAHAHTHAHVQMPMQHGGESRSVSFKEEEETHAEREERQEFVLDLFSKIRHNRMDKVMTALRFLTSALPTGSVEGPAGLRDEHGNTVLHVAAQNNLRKMAGGLLAFPWVDVNAVNKKGLTSLDYCDMYNFTAVGDVLVEHGAESRRQ